MKLNFEKKKTFRETKTVNAISLCRYSHQHTSLPSPHFAAITTLTLV